MSRHPTLTMIIRQEMIQHYPMVVDFIIAQEQGGLRPALSLVRGKKGKEYDKNV